MYNSLYPTPDIQRFNSAQVPYHRPPDVVGEGDVIPANAGDGSIQLYFVPAWRRHPYLYHFNTTHTVPANAECWYIRSICNENPTTFMNYHINCVPVQTPNIFGSQNMFNNLTRDTSNDYGNQYFQKFHNDNATSTTDIHYFYPSLRYGEQKLSVNVAIQTEFGPFICCNCLREFTGNSPRNNIEEMCVDDTQGTKSRYTNVEYSGENSNKLVATCMDASSNCTKDVSRQTQTAASTLRRSDVIAVEEYVPRRKLRKAKSDSCSSDCSCTGLS